MSTKRKSVTLLVEFKDLDSLKEFATASFPADVFVYQGDALDREFGGRAPDGAYVVRHAGQKPDKWLA